jgi:GrpB-like predicted nucleotidyltransferase (UPF0157 family)
MQGIGYVPKGAFGIEGRRFFQKFNAEGQRTHHLHVFEHGSPHIERHLAFRDYLRNNPSKAAAYSNLKAEVTATDGITRDGYMDAKDQFIKMTEKDAVDWFRRYNESGEKQ